MASDDELNEIMLREDMPHVLPAEQWSALSELSERTGMSIGDILTSAQPFLAWPVHLVALYYAHLRYGTFTKGAV